MKRSGKGGGQMSQPYDSSIKAILSEDAEDIVPYLLPGATIVQSLNIEVLRPPLRADRVYQISYQNTDHILHLEFQVDDDKEMPHRLLCYHAILWKELKKPVISMVIYLFPTKSKIPRPPLREWSGSKEILSFQYQLLEFWTIDARQYVQEHVVCMYTMLAMMKNADVPLLWQAIDELVEYYRRDEAKLARRLLWFRTFLARATTMKREEKRQVEERLDVFDKLLEDSPFVQKQKALAKAQGEAQGELSTSQRILRDMLKKRYPALAEQMQTRIEQMRQPETLHDIILQLPEILDEQQAYSLLDGAL
jgi:hypothetical protein